MIPDDNMELILGPQCEFVNSRVSGSLPDPQMTFTFVPRMYSFCLYAIFVD